MDRDASDTPPRQPAWLRMLIQTMDWTLLYHASIVVALASTAVVALSHFGA